MLSRVAASIFWMSRYIERAENLARILDVNFTLQLDLQGHTVEQWDPMIKVTGDVDEFEKRYDGPTRANVIQFLTFDMENPNSIVACVNAARENARTVREVISSEMWEEINQFYLGLRAPSAMDRARQDPQEFYGGIRRASHLIEGTKNETMPHGEAWHFSRMGRLLERADKTSRILDVKYFILLPSATDIGNPVDDLQWGALLRSASALEAYRKVYGVVSSADVAAFLLFDEEFPRSVRHCLNGTMDSLRTVSVTPKRAANHAARKLGPLVADLEYADITAIVSGGLHEFLDHLQIEVNDVGNAITQTFFAPQAQS